MPSPQAEAFCDRVLAAAASLALLLLLVLLAFGFLRGSGRVGASYGVLNLVLGALLAGTLLFLLLRRRLYRLLPASALALLVVGGLLPVACVETYANAFNPRGYHYYAESERYFQWQRWQGTPLSHAHPPDAELRFPWGLIETNAEGWRAVDHPREPAEGALRVLALGDSVVFSWGVDQASTVTAEIERALGADEAVASRYDRIEVINTGNCSFNSIDELIVLRSQGLAYRPHLVLAVAVDNDFTDRPAYVDQVGYLRGLDGVDAGLLTTLEATAVEREALQQPRSGPSGAFLGLVNYGIKRSFIATTAAKLVRDRRGRVAPPAPAAKGQPLDLADPAATAAAVERRYAFAREQTAALREIARTTREAGVPFVLFTYRFNAALNAYLRQRLEPDALVHPLDFEEGEDILASINSRTDSHWNADGTRLFGRKMARVMAEQVAN